MNIRYTFCIDCREICVDIINNKHRNTQPYSLYGISNNYQSQLLKYYDYNIIT